MADRAKIKITLITAAVLLGILSIAAPADTIYVNAEGTGDYPTIQAAIPLEASMTIFILRKSDSRNFRT